MAPADRARVVVIGLGPGHPGQLTQEAAAAIEAVPVRFVRTRRHPSAAVVGEATSFDPVYEAAQNMDEVYATIVEELVSAAQRHGTVLYAVPGSPLVAERTVELLRQHDGVEVEIQASLSFLDLAWARMGVDPVAAGVRLVDGHRFAWEAAGDRGPLLVAQADSALVLSDIKLSVDDGPPVVVLQRLGLPDEQVRTVAWADLDREVVPDHLTCLWIPALAQPVAGEMVRLDELIRTLRVRCPWDARQTHGSLTRHLLEETYEVLEAIEELAAGSGGSAAESDDGYDHLEEELGDLLYQVYFHAALAAEAGRFSLADVARGIHDKLVARHPQIFAAATPVADDQVADDQVAEGQGAEGQGAEGQGAEGQGAEGQGAAGQGAGAQGGWEQMKKAEKGRSSVMDGIPAHLPSLLYASKVQSKAASVGFDWDGVGGPGQGGAWEKLPEELAELAEVVAASPNPPPTGGDPAVIDELGDLLFSVVNVARHLDVDPETALRGAARKFRHRFIAVESLAGERHEDGGASLDVAGWDELWNEVKMRAPATGRRLP